MIYFQGGMVFVLVMSESLPPNMDSAVAFFGSVPVQVTKHRTTLKGIVPREFSYHFDFVIRTNYEQLHPSNCPLAYFQQ